MKKLVLLFAMFSFIGLQSQSEETGGNLDWYLGGSLGLSFATGDFAKGGNLSDGFGNSGLGPRGDLEVGFYSRSGLGAFGSLGIQLFETDFPSPGTDIYWIFMGAQAGPQYRFPLTDKLYGVAKAYLGLVNADLVEFDTDSDLSQALVKRLLTYGGKVGFTYMLDENNKWAVDGLMSYNGLKANHDTGLGEIDVPVGFLAFNLGFAYHFK